MVCVLSGLLVAALFWFTGLISALGLRLITDVTVGCCVVLALLLFALRVVLLLVVFCSLLTGVYLVYDRFLFVFADELFCCVSFADCLLLLVLFNDKF